MSYSLNPHSGYQFYKSVRCGFCSDSTSAEVRGYTDIPDKIGPNEEYEAYLMCRCLSCNRPSLVQTSSLKKVEDYIHIAQSKEEFGGVFKTTRQWPPPPQPDIPENLPGKVQEAYLEAEKAYINELFSSSAMQYRRSLELSCKELGEEKGNLSEKIKALGEAQKLSPAMIQWADRIRFIGNAAAHDEPLPDGDAKAEAEEIRYFSEAFMTYAFTLPEQIKEYSPTVE